MEKAKLKKIIREEYRRVQKEELSIDDMNDVQQLIRAEIASVLFDLWKKRKTWMS